MDTHEQGVGLLVRDGSALVYVIFLPFLAVFVFGLLRRLEPLPPRPVLAALRSRAGLCRILCDALLQRKVLHRPAAGLAHAALFWGFAALLLGDALLALDRILRLPLGAPLLVGATARALQAALDAFGLLFVAGALLAALRRFALRPPGRSASPEKGLILCSLLFVGVSGFAIEGLRMQAQPGPADAWAFAGHAAAGVLATADLSERGALLWGQALWWSHMLAAFALIAALPFSHLFHALGAPIQMLLSSTRRAGALRTPFRLAELIASGRLDAAIGAERIGDFSANERWAFAACTDCGRCETVCPAHATGTALSPRRLLCDLKRALETWRPKHGSGAALLGASIAEDAVWACTMCGACAQVCPVSIDPVAPVAELRRGRVARGQLGAQRCEMLSNLSRTANPYGSPRDTRQELAESLGVSTLDAAPDVPWIYWIGCAASFDPRSRRIAHAMIRILEAARVEFAILGPEERCTGDCARRIGEEGRFQELALQNIAALESRGVKKVLTHCAHCFNTFRSEYPELGARFESVHHADFIAQLIAQRRLPLNRVVPGVATLHDACYVGRIHGQTRAPRSVLRCVPGIELVEMDARGASSFCCGAGGGNYWYDVPRRERMGRARMRQAAATGAQLLIAECPYCIRMLEQAGGDADAQRAPAVLDLSEVVARALA